MARSDFNYIPVNAELGSLNPTWRTSFPVELSAGQSVVDDAYLLITVNHVNSDAHRIFINNVALTGFDIPSAPGKSVSWFTYMDRIQTGVLRGGMNEVRIDCIGGDFFRVKEMVIHWREA